MPTFNNGRYRYGDKRAGFTCPGCDETFPEGTPHTFVYDGYHTTYAVCSMRCYMRVKRNSGLSFERECKFEFCFNQFTPKRSDAQYCSAKCRVAAHRRAKRKEQT